MQTCCCGSRLYQIWASLKKLNRDRYTTFAVPLKVLVPKKTVARKRIKRVATGISRCCCSSVSILLQKTSIPRLRTVVSWTRSLGWTLFETSASKTAGLL